MPNTRPRIEFSENGVCNACKFHDKKRANVNWSKQKNKLIKIFNSIKKNQKIILTV